MTGSLRYPAELREGDVDYMLFQAHEYRTNREFASQANAGGSEGPSVGSPVILYMPNSTPAVANQNNWQSQNFEGPLGLLLGDGGTGLAAGIQSLAQDTTFDMQATIDGFKQQLQNVRDKSIPAVGQFATQAIGAMTAGSGNNLLAIQRGQIYNPNVELLYQGTGMRQFSFGFNFLPKNPQEAQTVNKIILEFKKWSSPSNEKGNGMLEIPKIWSVKYMSGGSINKNMNQFKRCALLGVTVQANPSSNMHQSLVDGMPVMTSMSLAFQEVDIILREDHTGSDSNQGY